MRLLNFIISGFKALIADVRDAVDERKREHLADKLDARAADYEAEEGQPLNWRDGGIVDLLKAAGFDSGKAFRKELAAEAGIKGYEGTGEQNTRLRVWLIDKLKSHEIPL